MERIRALFQGLEIKSLEHNGCKIIGYHSRNLRSWAQQVSNLLYSSQIINEIFKLLIYDHKFTMLNAFSKFLKNLENEDEIMLNTFSRSLITWETP